MAKRIWNDYFIPGGKPAETPYPATQMHQRRDSRRGTRDRRPLINQRSQHRRFADRGRTRIDEQQRLALVSKKDQTLVTEPLHARAGQIRSHQFIGELAAAEQEALPPI